MNDKLICDDLENANEFNNFFVVQMIIEDSNKNVSDRSQTIGELKYITLQESDVEDALLILKAKEVNRSWLDQSKTVKGSRIHIEIPAL